MATKSALSNVDIIRRFVYENQPISLDEIAAALKAQMSSIRTEELARKNAELVLAKNSYFRQDENGGWEIDFEQMPEYQVLHGVMREAHQMLYERDVRTKVAHKLGVKVGSVVLDLVRAKGMKRFGPSRWGLEEWVLSNDAAAEVLKKHTGGLSEKDLTKHVADATGVTPDLIVFQFVGDKRFVADRKLWLLKEHFDSKKAAPASKSASPKRKNVSLDEGLETGFLQAQVARAEGEEDSGERLIKSRLRKANIKVAQEIVESREDLQPKPEDFAARLSQVLSNAGVDDYGVRSFQRVESAAKERGLGPKERDEINQFITQLLEQDTVGVGASVQSIANAPLSARKMQDVLRLKYINYTRDRAVIPTELNKFLVELLRPTINTSILHPSSVEGLLAVELCTYLYDHLEDAAWALTDDSAALEIVQRDGQRYTLSASDPQLIEQARDRFIVTQVDLVNHFLNNRYTGIESDKILARAARVITRLSGFENAYIVSRDYLSELPEVFGYQHDEENLIPDTFNMVLGNFTFTQDNNLAAGYLETSLKVLAPGGRLGVFVLGDLLTLLKEHALLGDFLRGMAVTHMLHLPLVEGRHKVVALVIEALPAGQTRSDREIAFGEAQDLRGLNQLAVALRDNEPGNAYKLIDPNALGTLI
ncbi:MAG: hypothetical protein M3R04_00045 [bacterium]|nr:hypothetical protein [bacterium]